MYVDYGCHNLSTVEDYTEILGDFKPSSCDLACKRHLKHTVEQGFNKRKAYLC